MQSSTKPNHHIRHFRKPEQSGGRLSKCTALTLLLLLLAPTQILTIAQLPETPREADTIFQKTDFDLNQWEQKYQTGQLFIEPNTLVDLH